MPRVTFDEALDMGDRRAQIAQHLHEHTKDWLLGQTLANIQESLNGNWRDKLFTELLNVMPGDEDGEDEEDEEDQEDILESSDDEEYANAKLKARKFVDREARVPKDDDDDDEDEDEDEDDDSDSEEGGATKKQKVSSSDDEKSLSSDGEEEEEENEEASSEEGDDDEFHSKTF